MTENPKDHIPDEGMDKLIKVSNTLRKGSLDDLLHFDPLAAGEEITGVSYKDKDKGDGFDNPATAVGFALAQRHAREKERRLTELGDTTMQNNMQQYQEIITKYGFEKVLEDNFIDNHHGRETYEETYFIYAHRKHGLLLSFDSYTWDKDEPPHVNGGNVYYEWKPWVDDWHHCTSTGGMIRFEEDGEKVWAGSHDCREALIHKLNTLNNRGEFVTPWLSPRPWLWLLHYGDTRPKGYDYKAITNERISRLPQWVQDFIGPDDEKEEHK